jgi:hypothetical protein
MMRTWAKGRVVAASMGIWVAPSQADLTERTKRPSERLDA